jgi:hypothetical protein
MLDHLISIDALGVERKALNVWQTASERLAPVKDVDARIVFGQGIISLPALTED